jgi:hypothetical protein
MMEIPTATVLVNGVERHIACCTCMTCGNAFLVFAGAEFLPLYCPYCRNSLDVHEYQGKFYNAAGQEIERPEGIRDDEEQDDEG